DPRTATTPIVMLTGYLNEDVQSQALKAGVNGILTKPFSPLALEQTIRSLLSGAELSTGGPVVISRGAATQARGTPLPPTRQGPVVDVATVAPARTVAPATVDVVEPVATALRQVSPDRLLQDAQRRYTDLSETFISTIEALSTALELRTTEAEGHAQRVSVY